MKLLRIIPAALLALTVCACDNIGPDDRYIEMPPVEMQRVVLLEEFTGQLCVNCPLAHEVISQLSEQYGENIIAVSIHAGGDNLSIGEGALPGVVGLRNDEGVQYANEYSVNGLPTGMVNRTTGLIDRDLWATAVYKAVSEPAKVDIEVGATVAEGTVKVTGNVVAHANINGHLQLWLLENGITAMQSQPDHSLKMDAVHNHVFRSSINGHKGEAISLQIRDEQEFESEIAVKEGWNAENLQVVAFVYDGTGVLQAAQTAVVAE